MIWGIGIWCGVSAYGVGYRQMVWVSVYGLGNGIWCRVSAFGVRFQHVM